MRLTSFVKGFVVSLLVASATEAARPLCSAPNCARINRHLFSRFQRGGSLVARSIFNTRTLPHVDDISVHVHDRVDGLLTTDKIYDDNSDEQVSTSVWRPFLDGNNNWVGDFSLGLKFLTGCTTVVIIGQKGVYAAHFWEDIAMDPAKAKKYAPNLLHDGNRKGFVALSNYIKELSTSPLPPAQGQPRGPF